MRAGIRCLAAPCITLAIKTPLKSRDVINGILRACYHMQALARNPKAFGGVEGSRMQKTRADWKRLNAFGWMEGEAGHARPGHGADRGRGSGRSNGPSRKKRKPLAMGARGGRSIGKKIQAIGLEMKGQSATLPQKKLLSA
jgi:hypothetical protein